jgi:hypothetical protein
VAKVIILTALVGEGIDIQYGDCVVCSQEQAIRFLAVGYAREFTSGDEGRPVKYLDVPEAQPSKTARKEQQQSPPSDPAVFDVSLVGLPTELLVDAGTGVTADVVEKLIAAGLTNVELVRQNKSKIPGVGKPTLKKIQEAVAALLVAAKDAVARGDDTQTDEGMSDGDQAKEGSAG